MADFSPPADDAKIICSPTSATPFPLTTPGVPEVREYQTYGFLNDQQIGQPSDIVSVTFGG